MWLKLAAHFSDGPGAQSRPCLSQPPCSLGSSLVPSEKEETGSFPSIFGAGFKKAPSVCPLSLWDLPLHQSPGTYGRLHSSYLFLWLGVALCPQVKGPAVGGLREGAGVLTVPSVLSPQPSLRSLVPGGTRRRFSME